MAKGRGYYADDDDNEAELHDLLRSTMQRYLQQGCSMIESAKRAADDVERKTGFAVSPQFHATLLEEARRMDCMNDIRARSTPSGRPRKTASSGGYEDYQDPRRPQKSTTCAQPTSGTEYDRMFQNGADKFASRTSGKILTKEEIEACAQAMVNDLLAEGKSIKYAEQKVDQFVMREFGKKVAALRNQGYGFKEDEDVVELDAPPPRNARQGTCR